MKKTIKTSEVVAAVGLLKGLKLGNVDETALVSIWRNLSAMRPIVENYEKDVKEVQESLQDEKFNELQKRLQVAREKEEKANAGTYQLTEDDKIETQAIIAEFNAFNKKSEPRYKELADKEVEVNIEEVSAGELLKAFKSNDLELGKLLDLSFMVSD